MLISSNVLRDSNGEFIHTRCLTRDITQWRLAQAASADSHSRYLTLVDTVPALVVTTTPEGRTTFVNQQWCEYTGHTLNDCLAWPADSLIHPDDQARVAEAWATAASGHSSYTIDFRLKRHDGDYRWHSFHMRPTTSVDGALTGWTSACLDVDEARHLQTGIELANEKLEAALRMKDEVLGLVSHELRTPLTTLKGGTRLLSRRLNPAQEEQRAALAEIEASTERLERLIENMLVLARVDNGERPECEPVLLHRVVASAAQQCEARHPGRHIGSQCPAPQRPRQRDRPDHGARRRDQ